MFYNFVVAIKSWQLLAIIFLGTWAADQATKALAASLLLHPLALGPLRLVLLHNQGALLGLFAEQPPLLREINFVTIGAFLACGYFLLMYELPEKAVKLRGGMSFLMGGILGNVTDRICHDYVVDFAGIQLGNWISPIFNFADFLQWVGYGFIIYALFSEADLLWRQDEKRGSKWVTAEFQRWYIALFLVVVIALVLITSVFSYTYLRVSLTGFLSNDPRVLEHFLVPFLLTYILICLVFCFFVYILAKTTSHKIAGPLFAFEKFLKQAFADSSSPASLQLRDGDQLRHLESLAAELKKEIDRLRKQ